MLKYNITEGQGGRIVIVKVDDLMRYALHDQYDKPLAFKRIGGQAVALTSGSIRVYKKPGGQEFHREYMTHNGRSLWLGFYPRFDTLARNMYEFVQNI